MYFWSLSSLIDKKHWQCPNCNNLFASNYAISDSLFLCIWTINNRDYRTLLCRVSYSFIENSESTMYLMFENVPKEKISHVDSKLQVQLSQRRSICWLAASFPGAMFWQNMGCDDRPCSPISPVTDMRWWHQIFVLWIWDFQACIFEKRKRLQILHLFRFRFNFKV